MPVTSSSGGYFSRALGKLQGSFENLLYDVTDNLLVQPRGSFHSDSQWKRGVSDGVCSLSLPTVPYSESPGPWASSSGLAQSGRSRCPH